MKYSIYILILFIINYTLALQIACLGDSITHGQGSSDYKTKSYPSVLKKLINEPKSNVMNLGVGGTTVQKT